MSKELLDKMMKMSVDEILAEYDEAKENELLNESVTHELTFEEAASLFQREGTLTLEELDILMHKKIEEMANDGNNSNSNCNKNAY